MEENDLTRGNGKQFFRTKELLGRENRQSVCAREARLLQGFSELRKKVAGEGSEEEKRSRVKGLRILTTAAAAGAAQQLSPQ
jgi:hypothetical protein